ncbi:alpha/beta-hydrolase [Rhizoclosmatium globosum]|uniref:Alpha/beta-hydrolase n=1 Tax=Rhizoclosmatium globosum TaxID=329046 RepID=A0A1Y2CVQ0_9FUNG|nr:alpha/beta-hydrolase [Rhizoclosmatium globosum]|eukprot:ORY50415.1 alpha/beta-hydrolase [Rhizoclosmatium globosum]
MLTALWQAPVTLAALLFGFGGAKNSKNSANLAGYRALNAAFLVAQLAMFLDSFRMRRRALKEVLAFRNTVTYVREGGVKLIEADAAGDELAKLLRIRPPVPSSFTFALQGAIGIFWKPWDVDQINNVTYAYPAEVAAAGGDSVKKFMQLDIIRKKNGFKNRPVLLYVHGGAWLMGDKQQRTMPICYHFASNENWVVLNMNYRLAPKHKLRDMLIDIKRAIRWARENAHIHGGDPNFIAISGGSAGGHLCSLAALTPNWPQFQRGFEDVDTSVQACLAIYPAIGQVHDNLYWKRWFLDAVVGMQEKESQRLFGKSILDWVDPFTLLCNMDVEARKKELMPFFVVEDSDNIILPRLVRGFVSELWKDNVVPVGYLEVPYAPHAFDFAFSPKVMYVCWAAGNAMEAIYDNWVDKRRQEFLKASGNLYIHEH